MGREGWEEQKGTHRKHGKARRSSEKPGRAVTWDGSAVRWRMDTDLLTANGGVGAAGRIHQGVEQGSGISAQLMRHK